MLAPTLQHLLQGRANTVLNLARPIRLQLFFALSP
jgi:hypothetical protein